MGVDPQPPVKEQDVFERGVINVFKGLSQEYKTNNPCYFGKKTIVNNLVKHDRWGYSLNGLATRPARRSGTNALPAG